MNKLKQGLIESAGDLTASKKRVIAGVEQAHHSQPKKRSRFMPVLVTVLFLLFIGVFVSQVVNEQSAQMNKQEDIVAFYQAIQEAYGFQELDAKKNAVQIYKDNRELLAYGEAKGVHVTAAQKQEITNTYLENIEGDIRIALEEKVLEKGYTMTDLRRFVQEHLGKVGATEKQLLAMYEDEYPGFSDMVLNELIVTDAVLYAEENNPEQVAVKSSSGVIQYGVVLAVEEGAFLFAPGFLHRYSIENRQKSEGTISRMLWIPKKDDWQVAVGDRVKVNIGVTFQESDAQDMYNPAGIGLRLEMVQDEIIQFEIMTTTAISQWQQMIDWVDKKVEFSTEPFYRFYVGEATYNAWLSPDKQWLELYESKNRQYAKVRVEKLAMWMW